jgi:hypothetical protein
MGVIELALLVVAEDFVCFGALLEDDLGLFALVLGNLIGMVLQGCLLSCQSL